MKAIKCTTMRSILLFLLITVNLNLFGQRITVDFAEINLCLKEVPSRTVTIGSTLARVKSTLGQPLKASKYFYEMDDVWGDLIEYPGDTKLYFQEGKLVSFDIGRFEESPITIGKYGESVKSPADLNRLYVTIPTFPANGAKQPQPYLYGKLKYAILRNGNIISDSSIHIFFNTFDDYNLVKNGFYGGMPPLVNESIRGIVVIEH